jgi:sortase A
VDEIVLAGGSGRTIAFGPGHLDGSADPARRGNCVLAGHRDTHFSFLKDLNEGDLVLIETVDGRTVPYEVRDALVVDETELWVLGESEGCRLTLVTCFPFDDPIPGGPLRYVVRADAVFECPENWRNAGNGLPYPPAGRSGGKAAPQTGRKG